MHKFLKKSTFLVPRILGILFAMFLMLFSLDVFDIAKGFWDLVLGLFIHNIPSLFMIAVVIIAWKWEWIGTVVFLMLSLLYIVWAWGKFPFMTYLIIVGPMVLISILFLINWIYRREIRAV